MTPSWALVFLLGSFNHDCFRTSMSRSNPNRN
jgi:hypothetical protein